MLKTMRFRLGNTLVYSGLRRAIEGSPQNAVTAIPIFAGKWFSYIRLKPLQGRVGFPGPLVEH